MQCAPSYNAAGTCPGMSKLVAQWSPVGWSGSVCFRWRRNSPTDKSKNGQLRWCQNGLNLEMGHAADGLCRSAKMQAARGHGVDISFVILSWNSKKYLSKCVDSIVAAFRQSPLSYEILILDNGSRDGSSELLSELAAAHPDRLSVTYQSTNLGTTRSRNILFKMARGSFVCVMDADVEVQDGVLDHLIPMLQRDQQLGLVVPRILYPSGAWQKSFDRFPTMLDKINRFLRLRKIEQDEAKRFSNITSMLPFTIDYAISAFWLMRRSLLEEIGGLDEKIFYAPEDVDFCLRVWQAGYRIVYAPAVFVVHYTQEISRGFKLNRAKFSHMKGLAYYFAKHGYLFRRPHFRKENIANHAQQQPRLP